MKLGRENEKQKAHRKVHIPGQIRVREEKQIGSPSVPPHV